jgi:hypothetical protein
MPPLATITMGTMLDPLRAGQPIESCADRAKFAGQPTTIQPGETHGR